MVERLQSPDLEDPLIDNSTFSLFFRTFGDLMKAADSQQPDLEAVHHYLKSTALKSPNKLLEQAKTILSSSSELPNSELPFQMASEEKVGAAAAKGNDHPPERRPALNRKRARFSLKPVTSQPSLYVNPSLNIDQLEDPEDYFLAHEKLENAEKELRKQRGDALMGLDQYNLTETARHRRPGMLGKRASYKHHPLLLYSEKDETIASSKETSEVGISSPPKDTSAPETTFKHGSPQKRKIADEEHVDAIQEEDSVALKENRVGRLWDELLSANSMYLDGDRAATFLQERLQFKPISLDKLSLPDLDSVLRNNLEAPVERVAKPRKALADIHNTIRRADHKASEEHRQLLRVSVCPQASCLEQKSPPASLSFLKRCISHMNSPSDPFLALGGVMSPASVEGIGKRALRPNVVADHLDADNHTPLEVGGKGLSCSGELQSQLVGEEGNTVLRNDLEAPAEQLAKPIKVLADIQSTIRRADREASEELRQLLRVSVYQQASHLEQKSPPASLSFLKRRSSHMNSPSDSFLALGADMSPTSVEGIAKQALPHVVADHLDADNHTPSEVGGKGLSSSAELHSQLVGEEGNTAANTLHSGKLMAEDLASSLAGLLEEDANGCGTSTDLSSNGSKGGSEDKIEDVLKEAVTSEQPELVIEGLTMDTLHCGENQLDQSGPTAGEYGSVDGHPETRDIPLEQNDEVNELNSRTPPNMHTKPKLHAHQRGKRTKFSHRQSLAGAGSLWESGVRRSNRIKIKPLEWWNGERFLYGRIHQSLETVIGLKYASPAKGGGKPTFRVKSFVSDEYKHLVEKAGLH